jgi:hypothetical protein
MSSSTDTIQWPATDDVVEVEVVELHHIERPIRGLIARAAFVVAVVVLAVLVAIVGLPDRSTFSLDTPLPNLFAPASAP